ncbi:hypothetical protein CKO50_07950 [Pseudoalteromonas sp. HM-SA03]|uniref:hypothetical protein n=1 Tax=Pseudoalteromonas sp. HM-SA03 TaxID=2029678 RepID=UPI000BAE1559|nr:hypothetical protein [Pseudoalteromonas sp. HM-SA03]PAY01860.1 hypothetical protein CKO50_07950 [Pseudoalteromonas sp. HM-SA03]
MVNKFSRGLTADEAALIALELDNFNSISALNNYISDNAEWVNECKALRADPYGDGHAPLSYEEIEEFEEIQEKAALAVNLRDALLDEIQLAYSWIDYNSSVGDYYELGIHPTPPLETRIEIFQESRRAPDDEYPLAPLIHSTKVTKISLAKWFYANYGSSAEKFDPTESYKETINYQKPPISQPNVTSTLNQRTKDSNSLLVSLGVMAFILSKQTKQLERGGKPNFSAIKGKVQLELDKLGLEDDDKVVTSNLNKDLGSGFKLIEELLKKSGQNL